MCCKIVAVCNCPVGVAHTYMVAEALMRESDARGYSIKVETQGAFGTDYELNAEDIAEADFVILALGATLPESELQKFVGKRIIRKEINEALRYTSKLFDELESMRSNPKVKKGKMKKREFFRQYVFSHLMKGMSVMLPVALAAGLLIAIATIGTAGDIPPRGTYGFILYGTGLIGLELMVPVLAAGIAYSIGDKFALAPALIGSCLMMNESLLATIYQNDFLGAILTGLLAGYIVKGLRKIRLSKPLRPMMGFLGIPFISTLCTITCIYYIIAPIVSAIMLGCTQMLGQVSTRSTILVCIVIAIMLVSDMGGPINKTAYLFAFSMVGEGYGIYFGTVALVTALPSTAVGLATLIRPKLFDDEECDNGKSALLLGLMGISEPAIMYVMKDPFPVMGAQIIGAVAASILGCLYGIERLAPGINLLDPLFGNTTPMLAFYCIWAIGVAINTLLIILLKRIRRRTYV